MGNLNKNSENGMLTDKMDIGSKGFFEFQSILLNKAKDRTEKQKKIIELLGIQYQMEDYINSEKKEVKSAGTYLKMILNSLNIKQNKFAEYIGLRPSNLNKLIKGERPINYDLALIFGKLFNHDPMIWIEIQAKNEIKRLVNAKGEKYSDYSLNDLIKE